MDNLGLIQSILSGQPLAKLETLDPKASTRGDVISRFSGKAVKVALLTSLPFILAGLFTLLTAFFLPLGLTFGLATAGYFAAGTASAAYVYKALSERKAKVAEHVLPFLNQSLLAVTPGHAPSSVSSSQIPTAPTLQRAQALPAPPKAGHQTDTSAAYDHKPLPGSAKPQLPASQGISQLSHPPDARKSHSKGLPLPQRAVTHVATPAPDRDTQADSSKRLSKALNNDDDALLIALRNERFQDICNQPPVDNTTASTTPERTDSGFTASSLSMLDVNRSFSSDSNREHSYRIFNVPVSEEVHVYAQAQDEYENENENENKNEVEEEASGLSTGFSSDITQRQSIQYAEVTHKIISQQVNDLIEPITFATVVINTRQPEDTASKVTEKGVTIHAGTEVSSGRPSAPALQDPFEHNITSAPESEFITEAMASLQPDDLEKAVISTPAPETLAVDGPLLSQTVSAIVNEIDDNTVSQQGSLKELFISAKSNLHKPGSSVPPHVQLDHQHFKESDLSLCKVSPSRLRTTMTDFSTATGQNIFYLAVELERNGKYFHIVFSNNRQAYRQPDSHGLILKVEDITPPAITEKSASALVSTAQNSRNFQFSLLCSDNTSPSAPSFTTIDKFTLPVTRSQLAAFIKQMNQSGTCEIIIEQSKLPALNWNKYPALKDSCAETSGIHGAISTKAVAISDTFTNSSKLSEATSSTIPSETNLTYDVSISGISKKTRLTVTGQNDDLIEPFATAVINTHQPEDTAKVATIIAGTEVSSGMPPAPALQDPFEHNITSAPESEFITEAMASLQPDDLEKAVISTPASETLAVDGPLLSQTVSAIVSEIDDNTVSQQGSLKELFISAKSNLHKPGSSVPPLVQLDHQHFKESDLSLCKVSPSRLRTTMTDFSTATGQNIFYLAVELERNGKYFHIVFSNNRQAYRQPDSHGLILKVEDITPPAITEKSASALVSTAQNSRNFQFSLLCSDNTSPSAPSFTTIDKFTLPVTRSQLAAFIKQMNQSGTCEIIIEQSKLPALNWNKYPALKDSCAETSGIHGAISTKAVAKSNTFTNSSKLSEATSSTIPSETNLTYDVSISGISKKTSLTVTGQNDDLIEPFATAVINTHQPEDTAKVATIIAGTEVSSGRPPAPALQDPFEHNITSAPESEFITEAMASLQPDDLEKAVISTPASETLAVDGPLLSQTVSAIVSEIDDNTVSQQGSLKELFISAKSNLHKPGSSVPPLVQLDHQHFKESDLSLCKVSPSRLRTTMTDFSTATGQNIFYLAVALERNGKYLHIVFSNNRQAYRQPDSHGLILKVEDITPPAITEKSASALVSAAQNSRNFQFSLLCSDNTSPSAPSFTTIDKFTLPVTRSQLAAFIKQMNQSATCEIIIEQSKLPALNWNKYPALKDSCDETSGIHGAISTKAVAISDTVTNRSTLSEATSSTISSQSNLTHDVLISGISKKTSQTVIGQKAKSPVIEDMSPYKLSTPQKTPLSFDCIEWTVLTKTKVAVRVQQTGIEQKVNASSSDSFKEKLNFYNRKVLQHQTVTHPISSHKSITTPEPSFAHKQPLGITSTTAREIPANQLPKAMRTNHTHQYQSDLTPSNPAKQSQGAWKALVVEFTQKQDITNFRATPKRPTKQRASATIQPEEEKKKIRRKPAPLAEMEQFKDVGLEEDLADSLMPGALPVRPTQKTKTDTTPSISAKPSQLSFSIFSPKRPVASTSTNTLLKSKQPVAGIFSISTPTDIGKPHVPVNQAPVSIKGKIRKKIAANVAEKVAEKHRLPDEKSEGKTETCLKVSSEKNDTLPLSESDLVPAIDTATGQSQSLPVVTEEKQPSDKNLMTSDLACVGQDFTVPAAPILKPRVKLRKSLIRRLSFPRHEADRDKKLTQAYDKSICYRLGLSGDKKSSRQEINPYHRGDKIKTEFIHKMLTDEQSFVRACDPYNLIRDINGDIETDKRVLQCLLERIGVINNQLNGEKLKNAIWEESRRAYWNFLESCEIQHLENLNEGSGPARNEFKYTFELIRTLAGFNDKFGKIEHDFNQLLFKKELSTDDQDELKSLLNMADSLAEEAEDHYRLCKTKNLDPKTVENILTRAVVDPARPNRQCIKLQKIQEGIRGKLNEKPKNNTPKQTQQVVTESVYGSATACENPELTACRAQNVDIDADVSDVISRSSEEMPFDASMSAVDSDAYKRLDEIHARGMLKTNTKEVIAQYTSAIQEIFSVNTYSLQAPPNDAIRQKMYSQLVDLGARYLIFVTQDPASSKRNSNDSNKVQLGKKAEFLWQTEQAWKSGSPDLVNSQVAGMLDLGMMKPEQKTFVYEVCLNMQIISLEDIKNTIEQLQGKQAKRSGQLQDAVPESKEQMRIKDSLAGIQDDLSRFEKQYNDLQSKKETFGMKSQKDFLDGCYCRLTHKLKKDISEGVKRYLEKYKKSHEMQKINELSKRVIAESHKMLENKAEEYVNETSNFKRNTKRGIDLQTAKNERVKTLEDALESIISVEVIRQLFHEQDLAFTETTLPGIDKKSYFCKLSADEIKDLTTKKDRRKVNKQVQKDIQRTGFACQLKFADSTLSAFSHNDYLEEKSKLEPAIFDGGRPADADLGQESSARVLERLTTAFRRLLKEAGIEGPRLEPLITIMLANSHQGAFALHQGISELIQSKLSLDMVTYLPKAPQQVDMDASRLVSPIQISRQSKATFAIARDEKGNKGLLLSKVFAWDVQLYDRNLTPIAGVRRRLKVETVYEIGLDQDSVELRSINTSEVSIDGPIEK